MSLPKVKIKKFTITLPSDGKEYTFRPFNMGEQKILMMALESDDEGEMISALQEVIEECSIDPKVNVKELSSCDLDWILLKLRERSVGEVMEIMVTHPQFNESGEPINSSGNVCKHQQLIKLDTRGAKIVTGDGHTNKIILQTDPTIGITLKYPTANMVTKIKANENTKMTDFIFEFITVCIDTVFTDEEVFEVASMDQVEIQSFLLQFDQDAVMKIFTDFFDTAPKVKMETKYKCSGCGEVQEVSLEGLRNFM